MLTLDSLMRIFYLAEYDSKGLYDSLRNGLVHMFTIKGVKYALTHNHSDLHLKSDGNGQIILNASDFRDDLTVAKQHYFYDAETKPPLLDKWECPGMSCKHRARKDKRVTH